jgi:hypothetical protein
MEEDHLTPSSLWCSYSCCNGSKAAAIAALSFLSILTFTLFNPLLFCSQIIASFIGKHSNLLQHSCQIRWDKQALKYATICGINGATTCLVVGYCH